MNHYPYDQRYYYTYRLYDDQFTLIREARLHLRQIASLLYFKDFTTNGDTLIVYYRLKSGVAAKNITFYKKCFDLNTGSIGSAEPIGKLKKANNKFHLQHLTSSSDGSPFQKDDTHCLLFGYEKGRKKTIRRQLYSQNPAGYQENITNSKPFTYALSAVAHDRSGRQVFNTSLDEIHLKDGEYLQLFRPLLLDKKIGFIGSIYKNYRTEIIETITPLTKETHVNYEEKYSSVEHRLYTADQTGNLSYEVITVNDLKLKGLNVMSVTGGFELALTFTSNIDNISSLDQFTILNLREDGSISENTTIDIEVDLNSLNTEKTEREISGAPIVGSLVNFLGNRSGNKYYRIASQAGYFSAGEFVPSTYHYPYLWLRIDSIGNVDYTYQVESPLGDSNLSKNLTEFIINGIWMGLNFDQSEYHAIDLRPYPDYDQKHPDTIYLGTIQTKRNEFIAVTKERDAPYTVLFRRYTLK